MKKFAALALVSCTMAQSFLEAVPSNGLSENVALPDNQVDVMNEETSEDSAIDGGVFANDGENAGDVNHLKTAEFVTLLPSDVETAVLGNDADEEVILIEEGGELDDESGEVSVVLEFSPESVTGGRRRLQLTEVNDELRQRQAEYNSFLPTRAAHGGKLRDSAGEAVAFNEHTIPTLVRRYFNGAFVSRLNVDEVPELSSFADEIVDLESLNGIGFHVIRLKSGAAARRFVNALEGHPWVSFIERDTLVNSAEPLNKTKRVAADAPADLGALKKEAAPTGDVDVPVLRPTEGEVVEDDETVEAQDGEYIPNDTYFSRLWGFRQTSGFDMQVAKMWGEFNPNSSLVEPIVAVLDSGTELEHPDLVDRLWVNQGEIPGDGIDNDGNGYIDDIYGWNFISNIPAVTPASNSHGTHCAGSVLATGNNGQGVVGGFFRARLMTAQMLNENGSGPTSASARAVNYAAANGAHIASCSWTGNYTSTMFNAMKNSPMLHVCAAGNGGVDMTDNPRYPAALTATHNNVLSVGAVQASGIRASFSNYGNLVDVFAPGVYIWSTCLGQKYCSASGTSMATPNAAGIAAALYAKGMSVAKAAGAPYSLVGPFAEDVKKVMIDTVTKFASLQGLANSNGLVNALNAVKSIESVITERIQLIKKDCVVGAWSDWSACPACTSGATQTRTRQLTPPQYGGAACPAATETRACPATTNCPVDCKISAWSNWSDCSASCGPGNQTRKRTITQPTNGGAACPANTSTTDTRSCNNQNCPVDCVIGLWGGWSTCSASCGTGEQTRTRPLTPPVNGGASCPEPSQTKSCELAKCPCELGEWGAWSACSVVCGTGQQKRSRFAVQEGCSKSQTQIKTCTMPKC